MPRPEKVQAVADIKERLEGARAVFVAEYSGLSVKEQQELRRGLRAVQSEFRVYKMTLARIAAEETGHEALLDLLVGPSGLMFANEDAASTAKQSIGVIHECVVGDPRWFIYSPATRRPLDRALVSGVVVRPVPDDVVLEDQ